MAESAKRRLSADSRVNGARSAPSPNGAHRPAWSARLSCPGTCLAVGGTDVDVAVHDGRPHSSRGAIGGLVLTERGNETVWCLSNGAEVVVGPRCHDRFLSVVWVWT